MKRILYQNRTAARELLLPKNSMLKFGGITENARLDREGNLILREGFATLHTFSATIRGTYYDGGEGYVLSGNSVYYYDGEDFTQIGTVASSTGICRFEILETDLFLYDGNSVYLVTDSAVTEAEAYVPLLGKDWDPANMGEINEPLNLLADRARIQFSNPNRVTTFALPYYPDTVDKVLVNGRATTNFTLSGNVVTVPEASAVSNVTIAFSGIDVEPTALLEKTEIYHCRDDGGERWMLYGGTTGVFEGRGVPVMDLRSCRSCYPNAKGLYFPEEDFQKTEDVLHYLGGWYEDYLGVSGEKTYYRGDDGYVPVLALGCSEGCAIPWENGVLMLSGKHFYRLTASYSHPETITAKVSDKEAPDFDSPYLYRNRKQEEVWCVGEDEVRVYTLNGEIYRFNGFEADRMCDFGGTAFVDGGTLYRFSDTLSTDNGEAIPFYMETNSLVIATPEGSFGRDYLLSVYGIFGTARNDITVTVKTDTFENTYVPNDWDLDGMPCLERKAFNRIQVVLEADCVCPLRLDGLSLMVKD